MKNNQNSQIKPAAEKQILEKPATAQRQTAVKSGIREIQQGKYIVQEGWEPNYIRTIYGDVSRINLIGVIVSKANTDVLSYDFFVLDDGTARITVRSFENKTPFDKFEIGNIVNVIGRPREFGGETYITPEIIKKVDNPLWAELRKIELKNRKPIQETEKEETKNKTHAEKIEETKIEIEEEMIVSPEEKIIKIIKDNDKGDGYDIEEIIQKSGNKNAQEIIKKLMQNGEIFEVRPGRVKVL